jgi:hypothetical protein
MALRVQLINDKFGSVILELADPIDINTLSKTIKRSEEFEGVFFTIVFDLEFPKDGRDFLKNCYELDGGVDCICFANVYSRNANLRKWEAYTFAQVNFNRFELTEISCIVNLEQLGVERRITNLIETDVDLETVFSENNTVLPEQNINFSLFHSKAILKGYDAAPINNNEFQQLSVGQFNVPNGIGTVERNTIMIMMLDLTNEKINEAEQTFTSSYGAVELNPHANADTVNPGTYESYLANLNSNHDGRFEIYRAIETGTIQELEVRLRLKPSVFGDDTGGDTDVCGDGVVGNVEVFAWLEKRDIEGNITNLYQIGEKWDTPGCGGNSRIGNFETKILTLTNQPVNIGDRYFIYLTYRVYGIYGQPSILDSTVIYDLTIEADKDETFFKFSNRTSFAPTQVKNIFLHDAIDKCVQYYTNTVGSFKSTLLGRTEIGYPVDGEGALLVINNGHWLRGRNEKKCFANLEELIKFCNVVFCVGFGFIEENNKQIFVIEKREFFYNKNLTALDLGKVYNIKRRVDHKKYYNSIEIGYSGKLDLGQTNAIDEFNTTRKFSIPIVNTKNVLKITTPIKVGGYQIEAQRRYTGKTVDSNQDDELFIISMVRDAANFKPKILEGYESVENVFDANTGYNYDLSPARIFKNWQKIIASSLIRSKSKLVKFSSGEVNYEMVTKKFNETVPVAENGNYDFSQIEAIYDNEVFEFENQLTAQQTKALENSKFGAIKFQDKDGNQFEGFISEEGIEHTEAENKGIFKLRKVFL